MIREENSNDVKCFQSLFLSLQHLNTLVVIDDTNNRTASSTYHHFLQAIGQASGGHSMTGPLDGVQVLKRPAHTVTASQRCAALLCLPLQQAQRVRNHWRWHQTVEIQRVKKTKNYT